MADKVFRYLGFALESLFAEEPAPVAQLHLDLMSATLDAPTETEVMFEGSLGRGAQTHRPGFYTPSGNYVVAVDTATAGWFFYAALGGQAFTVDNPGVGQNTHEVYGVDDALLPSICIRIGKDLFEHVFSGQIINSMTLEVTDGFATITVDGPGAKDAADTLLDISALLLHEESPLMFHEVTATRNAGDVTAEVKTFTLTITNNSDAEFGRSLGSRFPRKIVSDDREVTIGCELFFEDTDELERYWGAVSGPSDAGTTEFAMDFVLTDPDDQTITIAAPRLIYTTVPQQPSGRTQIAQSVEMKAYTDTHTLLDLSTVESEILVTIVNAEAEMLAA